MSHQLISRNPDLKRLRDEGYDLEIRAAHLLVKNVPYVNAAKEVKLGTLVSQLSLAGDVTDFLQHNAFRSPGAPSLDDLRMRQKKVAYLQSIYARMHRGIVAHENNVDDENVAELLSMDFVFLCIDDGRSKDLLLTKLDSSEVPFIDVGMGLYVIQELSSIGGIVRATTSTRSKRDHARSKISTANGNGNNEYAHNIQIADLNALNAALAVIKWKKLFGFYHDQEREHHCAYTLDGNHLLNEDK